MRLWDALDQQLLARLQYFGVADDVDLTAIEWRRGGYAQAQLSDLYTGDDARTAKVLRALREGEPPLPRFLDDTGIELHDLSRASIGGWAGLRRLAGTGGVRVAP